MGMFKYKCECGNEFEEIRKADMRFFTTCPKCKKRAMLVVSYEGQAVHFKGEGFHKTDYPKEKK